jgi:hypothetical protein
MASIAVAQTKSGKKVKKIAKKAGSSVTHYGKVYFRNLKEGPNPGHFDE